MNEISIYHYFLPRNTSQVIKLKLMFAGQIRQSTYRLFLYVLVTCYFINVTKWIPCSKLEKAYKRVQVHNWLLTRSFSDFAFSSSKMKLNAIIFEGNNGLSLVQHDCLHLSSLHAILGISIINSMKSKFLWNIGYYFYCGVFGWIVIFTSVKCKVR